MILLRLKFLQGWKYTVDEVWFGTWPQIQYVLELDVVFHTMIMNISRDTCILIEKESQISYWQHYLTLSFL